MVERANLLGDCLVCRKLRRLNSAGLCGRCERPGSTLIEEIADRAKRPSAYAGTPYLAANDVQALLAELAALAAPVTGDITVEGHPEGAAITTVTAKEIAGLGWWAISGEDFLRDLRRVAAGENPDLVYAEAYANADIERVEGDDDE